MISKWEWALLAFVGIPVGAFFGAFLFASGGNEYNDNDFRELYDAVERAIIGGVVGLALGFLAGYALWRRKPGP